MKLVPRIFGPLTALSLIVGCSAQDATDVGSNAADGIATDTAAAASDGTPLASEEATIEFGQVQEALSFTSLPSCRFFNEGLVYYVHSPSSRVGFYYCRSGEWRLVSTGTGGGAGPTGPAGATGAAGPRGATGANGATGPQGIQGPTGPSGSGTGASGPGQLVRVTASGTCRLIEIGVDDNRNNVLDTIEVDSSGQVCDGARGATGATGANGATGATGAAGPQGVQGPAGQNGANGATGAAGAAGPQGVQGPAGQNGAPGATGATGPQGAQGPQGPQGPTGPRGATGPGAPTGPTGPVCGNSIVEAGEQCDLGFANGGPNCSATCQLPPPPLGPCLACAQTRCGPQYANALGSASSASNLASVTQLLDCVIGPNFELGNPIPASSCFFADPVQPLGSLLPCLCGNTPQQTCIGSGPANPAEACGTEVQLASLCPSPVVASCVNSAGSDPATPLGDTLQLFNCERAACPLECGFPIEPE